MPFLAGNVHLLCTLAARNEGRGVRFRTVYSGSRLAA
jgi:hypothetical protein